MKFLALFLLMILAGAEARADFGWYCEAEGYNGMHQRFVVKSDKELVQWEAERSALVNCRDEGYTACRVQKCWEEN